MNFKGKMTRTALLAVAIIATFNCLVRSDYNLVIALVCYFFWQSRFDKEERVSMVIMILLAISEIFDIIWFFVVWNSWTGKDWSSPVWRRLRLLHIIVIITSFLNFFLKIAAIGFVQTEGKNANYARLAA